MVNISPILILRLCRKNIPQITYLFKTMFTPALKLEDPNGAMWQ